LFDDQGRRIALILKNRGPERLIGKWNAIGGKVEPGEPIDAAMSREFIEEAGVEVFNWAHFMDLSTSDGVIHFHKAYDTEALEAVESMESEPVTSWWIDELPVIVPNLNWIIPMCKGHLDDHVAVYEVIEKEPLAA